MCYNCKNVLIIEKDRKQLNVLWIYITIVIEKLISIRKDIYLIIYICKLLQNRYNHYIYILIITKLKKNNVEKFKL